MVEQTKRARVQSAIRTAPKRSSAPHLALVGVQLMFGTWPILGKFALRTVSSTTLVAIRILGAAVVFTILKRSFSELRQLPGRDLLTLLACSLLGVVLNQFLFIKGLELTTVINATLLGTAIPAFTLIVSIVLGHDELSLRRFLGVLLAAAGVIYLIDPIRADFSSQTNKGNVLIAINCLAYGAYIAASKSLFKRYGALQVITWLFLIGSVFTILPGIYSFRTVEVLGGGWWLWLILIYIVMVPTVGAYYLNAWALTRVLPSTVAAYIYLQPLIAFALAPFLLGERWNSRTAIASVLIFAGVAIVTKRGRSQAAKEVSARPDALAH
ncbi:MAG TPA: DMT family transporter [Pyrinomonadaceae bacterium]|nr:DMT family transporter [Pyrinomonadaceae bacterium]